MNFVEKIIETISPKWAFERERAKLALSYVRKYEGASKGNRLSSWFTSGTSANAETAPALATLRDRSRDLTRNEAYAVKAIGTLVRNIIGKGIVADIKGGTKGVNEKLSAAWKSWANSKECDADGNLSLSGLQRLACRTIIESGEVIIQRVRSSADNLTVPFQLKLIEPDHLDTSKDGPIASNGRILQGIEFDSNGKIVAYHLFKNHPGDTYYLTKEISSVRVPASEIIHIFRLDRCGQVRGVPWSAPVIVKLKDYSDFEDAQLMRQKIAACFSAFIYSADPTTQVNAFPTGKDGKARVDKLAPGTISNLGPGEQIIFANPPSVQNYGEYSSQILHRIAAGYQVPYELLTGDLSQVNFSSARVGLVDFIGNIEQWQQDLFVNGMLADVWKWFCEAAILKGLLTDAIKSKLTVSWTTPKRSLIDPQKEIGAYRDAVRSGFMSRSKVIAELGDDPEEVTEDIVKDNELLDASNLIFDSDPRKTSNSGQQQIESNNVGSL